MKISRTWLATWVTPSIDFATLVERLTMTGTKVETVEPVAPPFAGVVVGEVRQSVRHPEADKLSLCTVFDGVTEHQVVCGAPNVREGLKVPFARVGAELPGDVKIRRAKLRGVDSAGMLCSAAELGLGEDASGLLELPATLVPGADLRAELDLDDVVIEFDLTPNRGDCMSVRGIAREVGVLTGALVTEPDCAPVPAVVDDRVVVRLEDGAGCPRYVGRVIRDVDVTRPTPPWMAERLRRSGLRTIDPVVDVTNYVMLELGQPMHAFDLAVLQGDVVVRRARPGESLTLLDGSEVELDPKTLLITDAGGPIAMAGIMGGERSGIGPRTRDVFLECAFFAPLALAGTARRYGLQTDASQRFERGVDPQLQFAAVERATALLLEVVGGRPGPVVESVSPEHVPAPRFVELRLARLDGFVGTRHDAAEVASILDRLGFERHDGTWRVPSFRFDVEREVDLIEEVCRIRGYEHVPVGRPLTRLSLNRVPLTESPRSRVCALLVDLGYQELVTYSFIEPALQDLLDPGARAVTLQNPMSLDHSVLRTNLLPGLVKALGTNLARQQTRARLFELGRCFVPGDDGLAQVVRLGGLVYGERLPESWSAPGEAVDFFDLKGDVERVLALGGHREVSFEAVEDPVLHPGQSARIFAAGSPIGRLGRLHPEIEQRLELRRPVFVFELDTAFVSSRVAPRHREVSRYPSVRRDLSLLLDAGVTAARLEATVRAAAGSALVDFRLFDVYQGERIDSVKKSVAVGLTFQDPARTLIDSEINALMDAVVGALDRDLGARLR